MTKGPEVVVRRCQCALRVSGALMSFGVMADRFRQIAR